MSTLLFFHANCPDGVCAAAVAEYSRIVHKTGPLVLVPTQPGKVFEALETSHKLLGDASLDKVLFFDVSVRQLEFDTILHHYPRALVYDHHETTRECQIHPQLFLNQSCSGAALAWAHFFPGEPAPKLVQYIADRDLWKWELPFSRAINKYFFMHLPVGVTVQVPAIWLETLNPQDEGKWYERAIVSGGSVMLYEESLLRRMAQRHVACWIGEHLVAVCESTEMISDLGEFLSTKYSAPGEQSITVTKPTPPGTQDYELDLRVPYCYSYALLWSYDPRENKYNLSFRSQRKGQPTYAKSGELLWKVPESLAEIAGTYGGGGHPSAAGAQCSPEVWAGFFRNQAPRLRIPI